MSGRAYRLDISQGLDGLRQTREPDLAPGPGQILIAVRAVSLNYRDILVSENRYGGGVGDPVPTSDAAGEVIAVGRGVDRFKPGDRVCPGFSSCWIDGAPTPRDLKMTLGSAVVDGVLREHFICDAAVAAAMPEHLDFEEAACLPCAGVTAWNALYGPRPVQAGETVLTLGLGGVSSFAIQFARAAGARVLATSSRDAKLEVARALGAHETINYIDQPNWERVVLDLTEGRGVDHVVEVGGGGTLAKSIASTAVGGQVHMIGVLTDGCVDPRALIGWRTLRGVTVGSRVDFEAMSRMISVQQLRPLIDRVFEFGDARAAYDHLRSGGHMGKVVIRVE